MKTLNRSVLIFCVCLSSAALSGCGHNVSATGETPSQSNFYAKPMSPAEKAQKMQALQERVHQLHPNQPVSFPGAPGTPGK